VAKFRRHCRRNKRNDQPQEPALEPRRSQLKYPFTWTSNFIYHSPELKSQSLLVREVLAGWEVSPIITWQSGTPFSIGAGNSFNAYGEANKGDGCFNGCSADRADRVPGVPLKYAKAGALAGRRITTTRLRLPPSRRNLRQ